MIKTVLPMTFRRCVLLAVAGCLVAASGSLMAHHSTAGSFDMNKTVMLDGVISGIDLINPHVLIYLDVKGSDGKPEIVAVQGPSPNGLVRVTEGSTVGIKDRFKAGLKIVVSAFPSKSSYLAPSGTASKFSRMVEGGEIQFADGSRIDFGRGPKLDAAPQKGR